MSDIVERLRICANTYGEVRQKTVTVLLLEAADEIKRLRKDIESERKKHEWVPVEDRLPEKCKEVIVALKDKHSNKESLYTDWHDGEEWIRQNGVVTHWMHFPDPPKEKKNDVLWV